MGVYIVILDLPQIPDQTCSHLCSSNWFQQFYSFGPKARRETFYLPRCLTIVFVG